MEDTAEVWRERWQREKAARRAVEELLHEVQRRPHLGLLGSGDRPDPTLAGRHRDFLDVVSHELRTPLTILNGTLHILARIGEVTPQQQQVLGTASRATERLVRVVQNVEAWTSLQNPYHRWGDGRIDIAELALGVIAEAAPDRGALIEIEPDTDVAGSGELLHRCLANLVHNAVTYGSPPIRILARRSADGVEVVVTDGGDGLPMGRADLYAAFTQGDDGERRTSTGIGLGLSIVFRGAERFGWGFSHDRGEDGSAFRLQLPAWVEPSPVVELDVTAEAAPSRAGARTPRGSPT